MLAADCFFDLKLRMLKRLQIESMRLGFPGIRWHLYESRQKRKAPTQGRGV